jgi:hypothetical protein
MEEKDLTVFFDEYCYLSIFYRSKKLFELTNNLDLFLLKALKRDFTAHYLRKAIELAKEYEVGSVEITEDEDLVYVRASEFIHIHYVNEPWYKNNNYSLHDLNEEFDIMVGEVEYTLIKDIFEGMADFIYEIDDLILYSENRNSNKGQDSKKDGEIEIMDFSESTIVSKVVFLEKLGIIDFLRTKEPFNTSVNSLANVISSFSGAKSTSIQPLINAMLNNGGFDKNNPLKSSKTVKSVINQLDKIGYFLK